MALSPSPAARLCFEDAPPAAQDVARGVTRLFFNQDVFALCEVPLPNGRRADMM
ncbi:MAG: MmcB family DNA repair protein, partial [Allosphingosinicella sp.]